MKITLSFLVLLICCFSSFAQNTITLKGKILKDKTQSPIESATIYLIRSKDSSVVDYTISDKSGIFKLDTKKLAEKVILKVSGEGYEDFSQSLDKISADKDFGSLFLTEKVNALNEVVIKSVAPPVRVKKDTLEFNAASFKLRPDANVEALLRQLPGVVIDADKKITVNGKEVNQILVNGKSFFGEDGKVALQNLPAELIKKVQVSDTKTEEEKFTKQASTSNNASINLTIEKDKNKGFFGKLLAGYGTDKRYESSVLASYFKDKRRISFLGSANNINATGFSMDEVFDNMGGGRNNGSRAPRVGGGSGIIKSNLIGVNYADEWYKKSKSNGNYYYTNMESENKNKTESLSLLPDTSNRSESTSDSKRETTDHNFDFNFESEILPQTKLMIRPKIVKGLSKSYSESEGRTWNESNQEINKTNGWNSEESDRTNFVNDISVFKTMKRKGRYFTANFKNDNTNSDSNSFENRTILFELEPDKDVTQEQNVKSANKKDLFSGNFQYSEPITDSLSINIQLLSDWEKNTDDKKTFDFDNTTNTYSDLNELYSNFNTSTKFQIAPKAGFSINKKKFNIRVSTGTYMISQDNHSLYTGTSTDLKKNYIIPDASVNGSYRFSKTAGLYLFYDRRFSIPKDYQLLPVDVIYSPLYKVTGNPNLEAGKSHYVNLNYSNYDYKTRSGYYMYSSVTYNDNKIINSTEIDANGSQVSSYTNIAGTYTSYLGANYSKTFKKEAHSFGLDFGLYANYNFDKGYTNTQLFEAKTLGLSPTLRLNYDYGELLSIKPSYNFNYNTTTYDNSFLKSTSNRFHNAKIEITNKWPKKWVLGNDFGYSYNSNISPGFKKDFYLWNISLSYEFIKDMTFKIKVYDVLDQNQSASRYITPTAVIDSENTVLKRYAMFSLLYKFQNFETKKK
ncbi:TonB-dependent receptor [Flavobacterium eburneipallidum]|uniref:TonB-dependent receptor n=1 Tax=Flavobacterium eburneipallidum TaxID=3003263 RepID=UPI002482531B|nr:TonB-dependent receptor [Flavobacterium eburneipallidum]